MHIYVYIDANKRTYIYPKNICTCSLFLLLVKWMYVFSIEVYIHAKSASASKILRMINDVFGKG